MPLVLVLLVTATFFLVRAAPGNPFAAERVAAPEVIKNLNERYGLDRPPLEQFSRYFGAGVRFVGRYDRVDEGPGRAPRYDHDPYWRLSNWRPHFGGGVLSGDLGPSFVRKDKTVNEILADEIPATAVLGACATILAVTIGLVAGVIGAVRQNSVFDYAAMSVATLGMSVPNFVTGPMLVLVFAMMWNVGLPVSGYSAEMTWWPLAVVAAAFVLWRCVEWGKTGRAAVTFGREIAASWLFLLVGGATCVAALLAKNHELILPSLVLALPFSSRIARLMRAGMLEVINQDYVRTARAKGLAETTVVIRHALKGGILPVVSYLGPAVAGILTGSLVVEKIFVIPGIGREFVESAFSRDYTIVLGVVILDGLLLVVFNLIVDVVYGFLDPRIRYD
jgi:oligopeptide transport system permease protein